MKTFLILVVVGALLLSVPLGIADSKRLETENIVIDAGSSNTTIKVAHISDIHYPNFGVSPDIVLEEIKANTPDLLFLTGDIFDESATEEDILDFGAFLSKIGKLGQAYAVTGNHEVALRHMKLYRKTLLDGGIILLENACIPTEISGKTMVIAGIHDNNAYELLETDLASYDENLPILLLAHRPEKWEDYLHANGNQRPLVTFAGHAHGGQIRLFGRGMLSHGEGLFPKYTNGLYQKEKSTMIVSRGLGDSDFPLRFYNPYHLPIVTLQL
ncbi:MAG: metallophosphoesterase [Clostridia bacterium]|nr:metallophosphoesterase [Clostridia bacterium]